MGAGAKCKPRIQANDVHRAIRCGQFAGHNPQTGAELHRFEPVQPGELPLFIFKCAEKHLLGPFDTGDEAQYSRKVADIGLTAEQRRDAYRRPQRSLTDARFQHRLVGVIGHGQRQHRFILQQGFDQSSMLTADAYTDFKPRHGGVQVSWLPFRSGVFPGSGY